MVRALGDPSAARRGVADLGVGGGVSLVGVAEHCLGVHVPEPATDGLPRFWSVSYYQTVWTARRSGDIVLIKALLYTGVRVAELVAIRLEDVDLDGCRIRITRSKGGKTR